MTPWLAIGSRVKVRKAGSAPFIGLVVACWDFAIVKPDGEPGRAVHVMPGDLLAVLAPLPAPEPPPVPSAPGPAIVVPGATSAEPKPPAPPTPAHEALEMCGKCGRRSTAAHRRLCDGPPPRKSTSKVWALGRSWPARGEILPKCETCGRAIVRGRHRCRPLKRSHRRAAETDALPSSPTSTGARPAAKLLPFPDAGVTYDCKVSSELNLSGFGWRGRRARSRDQRRRTHDALAPYAPPSFEVFEVTITRTGWSMLDEHDNLPLSCKSVVDQIAEWLEVDDGDTSRVRWLYAQRTTRETEVVQTHKGPVSQSVNRLHVQIRERREGVC